ncbi:carbohydrate sulfotransferase 11-like [Penaeus japonicus]|uniref:carbohydrate sulfotransferase 11-like n=1 Tax=Penaeus japonicus TaxID=27405 RepID=UPI001C714B07|nr:carbohydrate sulfotransferase 11-like [Penaeus japonicus]
MAPRVTKRRLACFLVPVVCLALYISSGENEDVYTEDRLEKRFRIPMAKDRKDLIESVTLPVSWITSREHLQELTSRRQHVQETCRNLGLDRPTSTYRLNAWEFLFNEEYNLLWCNVFKAASSTWFWNFNLLAGYTEKELIGAKAAAVEMARRRYPRLSINKVKDILGSHSPPISFMITRHPFLRLVSAYRNKILAGNAIYTPLFATIYRKYKDLGPPVARRTKDGTLARRGISPSFSQFVQYILDEEAKGKTLDMHWIPQSRFCTPCLANFSIYAKVETLDEDGNHIIFSSGINHVIKPKTINRSVDVPTADVAHTFICQLSQQQFEDLVKLYQYDLQLFQYDVEHLRTCTRMELLWALEHDKLRRERVFKGRLNPLAVSDAHLLRYYRYPRNEIQWLCEKTGPKISRYKQVTLNTCGHASATCPAFYCKWHFSECDSVSKIIKAVTSAIFNLAQMNE